MSTFKFELKDKVVLALTEHVMFHVARRSRAAGPSLGHLYRVSLTQSWMINLFITSIELILITPTLTSQSVWNRRAIIDYPLYTV